MAQWLGRPGTIVYGVQGEDGRKLAHPLLMRAIQLWWGWESMPTVERSSRGKPFFPTVEGCHFSISHSRGYALVALSDHLVGVDIEMVRPRGERIMHYALSDSEFEAMDGTWEDFFRLWTLKESWVKLGDTSLYPPKEVPAPPPCPYQSYAGEGWRAAVCCSGEPPKDIIWLPSEEIQDLEWKF